MFDELFMLSRNNMQHIFRGSNPPQVQYDPDKFYLLKELEPKRSNDQNAFLHAHIYPECVKGMREKWMIVTEIDVHDFFKAQFLKKRKKCQITKRYRTVPWSTTTLTKKWFTEYVNRIEEYMRDNVGYVIPPCPFGKDLRYYDSIMS